MDKKVIVLTPTGHRRSVKVSPNTTLLEILEEVCRKHELESESYCLKHHNREVGLTLQFRFSGLPNNCLLELVESEKRRISEKVDICIQLEDGSRKLGQFKSSESIWNVVKQLSADVAESFEYPVVIYMRQEICGKSKLQETNLKTLGIIEGRALLRFVNKKPEELKTQANVYIPPVEKEINQKETSASDVKRAVIGGGGGGFSITKDLVKTLKTKNELVVATAVKKSDDESEHQDKTSESKPAYDWGTGRGHSMQNTAGNGEQNQGDSIGNEMETEPEIIFVGQRHAVIYSLSSTTTELEELPDSFYDLTVNDLKLVLRDLKRIATGNEDAPLMTEKLRELEQNKTMLNKMAQYKNCIIRIQFPDRHVLQGVFMPSDQITHVVDFVRTFLENQDEKFVLFTIPPKKILPLDKNLLELDLIPTAVLHFAWEVEVAHKEGQSIVLKSEYLNQLTSIEGAIYAANKLRRTHRLKSPETQENDDDEQPGTSSGAVPKRPRQ